MVFICLSLMELVMFSVKTKSNHNFEVARIGPCMGSLGEQLLERGTDIAWTDRNLS